MSITEREEREEREIQRAIGEATKILVQFNEAFPESFAPTLRHTQRYWSYNPEFEAKIDNISVEIKFSPRGGSNGSFIRGFQFDSYQVEVLIDNRYNTKKIFPQKKDGTFSWDKIRTFINEGIECAKARRARQTNIDDIREFNKTLVQSVEVKNLRLETWNNTRKGEIETAFKDDLTVEEIEKLDKFISELLASR